MQLISTGAVCLSVRLSVRAKTEKWTKGQNNLNERKDNITTQRWWQLEWWRWWWWWMMISISMRR